MDRLAAIQVKLVCPLELLRHMAITKLANTPSSMSNYHSFILTDIIAKWHIGVCLCIY